MSAHQRFESLKLVLPPAPKAIGVYKPCLVVGQHLYLSGHGPAQPDGTFVKGTVGGELDADAGKLAARQAGLTMLATIITAFGSLDKVKRVIKVLGMVNSKPDFVKHPHVVNGASELFAEVWGPEHGIGARSAFGVAALPDNWAVEVEAIFELA